MRRRGNAFIETAMFVPLLVLLLVGMSEIARVTYVYYSAQKALYGLARLVATRQGANLCDEADAEMVMAKNFALTGSSEGGDPLINGLSPNLVQVRLERQESGSDAIGQCECSLTGCDVVNGARPPDFVVVTVPDGFNVTLTIPYLMQETVTFRPSVRVPYGGS